MGGSSSTEKPRAVEVVYEKAPEVEDHLFDKIVQCFPKLLEKVNSKKVKFVIFCRDTWCPQRETTLDTLEDLQHTLINYQDVDKFFKTLKNFTLYFKIVLVLVSFYSAWIALFALFVLSFTCDFLSLNERSETQKVRVKIKSLMPVFETDRKNTEKAEFLHKEFRDAFDDLKDEVDEFVRKMRYTYRDVESNTPGIKRFLNRIVNVKANDKDEMEKFFQSFLELIHDYNASKQIFRTKAYSNYAEKCKSTGAQISSFLDDLNFYYAEIKIQDVTKFAISVAVSSAQETGSKIKNMRKKLDEDRVLIQTRTSGIQVKG